MKSRSPRTLRFADFYREVFLPEHAHPVNRALHVAGTLAGLGYLVWVLTLPVWPWVLALGLFPLVHAAPGLTGHRLFERSAAVGDARWRRQDFPAWWFIAANHRLTAAWLLAPLRWLRRPRPLESGPRARSDTPHGWTFEVGQHSAPQGASGREARQDLDARHP